MANNSNPLVDTFKKIMDATNSIPHSGGGRKSNRRNKKQRGGHLLALQPLEISGYGTPNITDHLPPGAISYAPQAGATGPAQPTQPTQGQTGGRRRSRHKKRSTKNKKIRRSRKIRRSIHKKSKRSRTANKPMWGQYLARMAHPKGAV